MLASNLSYWIVKIVRIVTDGGRLAIGLFRWTLGLSVAGSLVMIGLLPIALFLRGDVMFGFLLGLGNLLSFAVLLLVIAYKVVAKQWLLDHPNESYSDARQACYRISWTCRCGTTFHGHLHSVQEDFSKLRPTWYFNEADRNLLGGYCEKLVSNSSVISVTTAMGTYSNSGWRATTGWHAASNQLFTSLAVRAHIRNLWTWLIPMGRSAAPVLPLTEIRPEACSQHLSPSRYLLICLDTGTYAREMSHLDLADISSDKQLFSAIRNLYRERRLNRLADYFRPSAIQAIRFVQFTLRRAHMVDKVGLGVLPKFEDSEYIYSPRLESPSWKPPKGPLDNRYMLHLLLQCPALLEEDVLCLNQFPKKKTPLVHRNKDPDGMPVNPEIVNIGYGIYLKEGTHITRIYFLLLLGAVLLSLAVAAIYRCAVKGSTSDTLAVLAVYLAVVMISGMMLTLYQADAKVDDD